ncbi:unnamed protein product [Durusdinium trenchii]|uniref:Uncharacterized protein n=1 Tax=Durusdinium trenchii TaxID=1381693 RepID=A0ABP0JTW5_9DINO
MACGSGFRASTPGEPVKVPLLEVYRPRTSAPPRLRAKRGALGTGCLGARVHPWPAECTVHALQRSWNALCLTGMGLCTLAEKVLKDFLGEITWA